MKKLILSACLLATLACRSEVEIHGKDVSCVGIVDDEDPAYVYKYDARNIIIGVATCSTLVFPAWIIMKRWRCPVRENVQALPTVDMSGDDTATN